MPGGFDPFPRRPGSRGGRNIETLTQSMIAQRGTAYSSDPNSIVWLESTCLARAIATGWETNQKLANQFDPYRASDFLPRWEKIYGITPPAGATESDRRTAVAARWVLIGQRSNLGGLQALLQTLLPNTFVSVHYLPNKWAVNQTPVDVFPTGVPNTPTPPGTHPSAGTGNWTSTVHHIAIELQQPSWMSDEAYHREARSIYSGVLDSFVPAWVTFSAFKRDSNGRIAFMVDAAGNLDNEAIGIVSYGAVVVNGGGWTQKIFPYLFAAGSTGASSTGRVYANFYGFKLTGGPTHLTITLAVGTAGDTWGVLRTGTDPYTGTLVASFHNSQVVTAAADGDYTLEVSANANSTLGVSPGTITTTIASP